MNINNYKGLETLSALELGEKVNFKEISPVEVIEYFRARVESRNPSINAFVYTKFDEARKEAEELEKMILAGDHFKPLAGVPIGLKDFLPTKKGWTASHGGVPSLITVDECDSEFYKAAKSLGAIAIGKTNAPSFGFRGVCDNKMYGPTSTPFNVDYNSGGSSGGSASAVGDGLALACEGGDAGGSTRIPSAWCGCFGFKPSAGIVPSICRPDAWAATHPYCCSGPITKTVSDAAAILRKMIRFDLRDPLSVPVPANLLSICADLITHLNKPLEGVRIGVTKTFDIFPNPDDPVSSAIDEAAKLLKDLGAEIVETKFDFGCDREYIENMWLRSISIDTALDFECNRIATGEDMLEKLQDELPIKMKTWTRIAFSSTMMDYRKFHEIRTKILDEHLNNFEKCDILLAPVTGCLPVPNKNTDSEGLVAGPSSIGGEKVDPFIGFGYTYLENLTGFPAASVPFKIDSTNNLPVGIQLIGRRYMDDEVINVARCIEYVHPWRDFYKIPFGRSL